MNLTVSLAQTDIVLGDPAANLAKTADWVSEAAQQGADLVLFPELWSSGYDLARAPELASTLEDGFVKEVSGLAVEHRLWIAGSTLVFNEAHKAANRAILWNPMGRVVAWYDKIHLFGLMNEDQYLAPGSHLTQVETPWGQAGLAICYDLRFPEIFRHYALAGTSLIILPSEWPTPRQEHWRTLLRARAIENQAYVIACNRVGQDRDNTFCGHSAIISPTGEVLIEGNREEALLTATLDLVLVEKTRRHIPVFKDRRPELYKLS